MPKHTLYAYVDSSELHAVASMLDDEFSSFVSSRSWSRRTQRVNQKHPPGQCDGPNDIPLWDIGLNHDLPDPGEETEGWFDEVEAIAHFLGGLTQNPGESSSSG